MAEHPPRGHYPHRAEDVLNEEELEEMRRSELRLLEATLSGWLETPDAPICEISPYKLEKSCRPYSAEEVRAMRNAMKRHSWQTYSRLFYNEGPFVLPGAWPCPFRLRGLD
jgi:hypothetical protein